jgi:hypothetical protein
MNGVFENVKKRNIILSKLDERGLIKMDASGKFFERNIRIGQHAVGYRAADLAPRTFNRLQKYVTCAVPYAIKEVTGVLGEIDIMFNQGKEALIPLAKRMFAEMSQDFRISLCGDLLASNGSSNTVFGATAASQSPVPFYGLPTLFGYGASALAYDSSTQVVGSGVAATDKEVTPNTSYCGVSTHPTNAIAGVDNKLNESTSPVLVNWSSTVWGGTTWAANCMKVLNHMVDRGTRGTDAEDVPDLGIVSRSMSSDIKNALVTYYKVELSDGNRNPNAGLFKQNVIPFGPLEIFWDESQLASVCYVLNTKRMEFNAFPQKRMLLDGTFDDTADSMFSVKSQYSIEQGGHLAVANLAGQLWANPKFQCAAYSFA